MTKVSLAPRCKVALWRKWSERDPEEASQMRSRLIHEGQDCQAVGSWKMLEEHGRTWKNSNPPLDAKPYDWAGEQFGEQHHAGWEGQGHAMASMASLHRYGRPLARN